MGEEFNYTISYGQAPEIKELTMTTATNVARSILDASRITISTDGKITFAPVVVSAKVKAHILGIHPKKVIYRDKYTIVIWEDNTKTIVKCSNLDEFDKEKGFLMALTTKVYGKPVMNYLRKEFCEKVEKFEEMDNASEVK